METTREIVESVLSPGTTKALWTTGYWPALPFTPQDFNMGAVLTAVLYMFRWGKRRGLGKFVSTFGDKGSTGYSKPTIENVTAKVAENETCFDGFNSDIGKAILGDLLLTFCFENKKSLLGRSQQIQRVFPIHYFASWIDLPKDVANLRYIPELLVSILSWNSGHNSNHNKRKLSKFPLGSSFQDNDLLKLYGPGMAIKGELKTSMRSDTFQELEPEALEIGIDQLTLIRVAQECGEAPSKARGGGDREEISDQQPIATKATNVFREDINVLLQAYGSSVPRKAFSLMLESCLSLGFTGIYLSSVKMLIEWEKRGSLPELKDQEPWGVFVDCSIGTNNRLRALAEESMENILKAFVRFPTVLMVLRILDERVRRDKKLKNDLPDRSPNAVVFINLLGEVLVNDHTYSEKIQDDLEEKCLQLADDMESRSVNQSVVDALRQNEPDPAIKLAEALVHLIGDDLRKKHLMAALDAMTMANINHGLVKKRITPRKSRDGKSRRSDLRSMVLTNSMLDFLVHRHLRKAAKGKSVKTLSLPEFISILKTRYGFFINEAPPNTSIASEYLDRNKRILESRLRDLGLLVGVNDSESMKRLKPRYHAEGDDHE